VDKEKREGQFLSYWVYTSCDRERERRGFTASLTRHWKREERGGKREVCSNAAYLPRDGGDSCAGYVLGERIFIYIFEIEKRKWGGNYLHFLEGGEV